MTRIFIACHNYELGLVFKVTMTIESFHILNFKHLLMNYPTDQFDLCQGHSSNGHFNENQWNFIEFAYIFEIIGPRGPISDL